MRQAIFFRPAQTPAPDGFHTHLCQFRSSAFFNGLFWPGDDRLRHIIRPERAPVPLKVSAEQPPGQTIYQLGYGCRHGIDRRAGRTKAHGRGKCKQVNVGNPGRFSRHALVKRVIVGEIGVAAERRAALALRGLIAVGPGRDVIGKIIQFAALRKVDMGAGTADDKIRRNGTARRLQFDGVADLPCRLDRRAFVEMEIGEPRAAVVGRLRESLPQLENGAHETPAPGIVQIAEMPQEATKGQPSIGLDQLDFSPAAKQVYLFRARLKRGCCVIEGGRAGADHGNLLACQRIEIDRVRCAGHEPRWQMTQRLGMVQLPMASWPVASTIFLA